MDRRPAVLPHRACARGGARRDGARASTGVLLAPGRHRALDAAIRRAGGRSRTGLIGIFTFVTDRDVYSQMRDSFDQAGFTPERAAFTELTGTGQPDEPEPYSTITKLVAELSEPWFILCHQDLRLDQGHGIDELLGAVRELEERDDRWAVAGNAGGLRDLRVVRSLTDPHGGAT